MDERLKHKIVAAKEHFARREYDRTEPLLLQVLEKADSFADLHNMLGIVRHDRGDFAGAKAAFERAVELNPNYTEAQLNLVVVCNDLGDYDAGQAVFERLRGGTGAAVASSLKDAFALGKIANMHADLAQAYSHLGYLDEAARELQTAVALRPAFADLHARLGTLHRERGLLEEAQQAFEAACAANPEYTHARVQLGVTLYMRDRKDEAKDAFRHALSLDPKHKVAAMYLRLVEGR